MQMVGLEKIGKAFLLEDWLSITSCQQGHEEEYADAFGVCGVHFGTFERVGIALREIFEDVEERAAHVGHCDVDDHQAPLAARQLQHCRRGERDDTHAPTL